MKNAYVFLQRLNCLFAQFIAEQIEPSHVYIYVDWHVEWSTIYIYATVTNGSAERVESNKRGLFAIGDSDNSYRPGYLLL